VIHSSTSPNCGNTGGQFVAEMPLEPRQRRHSSGIVKGAGPETGLDHRPMRQQFSRQNSRIQIRAMSRTASAGRGNIIPSFRWPTAWFLNRLIDHGRRFDVVAADVLQHLHRGAETTQPERAIDICPG
jgi:hypothetical protein